MVNKIKFSKFFFILVFGCIIFSSRAGNALQVTNCNSDGRDTPIMNFLKAQPAFLKLSTREQDVLYWINYVRIHPREFYDKYVASYASKNLTSGNSSVSSLKNELYKTHGLTPMLVSAKLNQTTKSHASDLARHQQLSHNSSDGTTFGQRMAKAGIQGSIAENLYCGQDAVLDAVITLLIDEGVSDHGHRHNILNKNARLTGVAFIPYKSGSYILVEDFVGE